MHDLMYANQILGRLKREIKKNDKNRKVTIEVCLSPFSHVKPKRLKDTFALISEEEGFSNITLNVNMLEFCVHCKKCGQTWKSAKPTFKCPKCDSADFEVGEWDEFYIDSIKVDK